MRSQDRIGFLLPVLFFLFLGLFVAYPAGHLFWKSFTRAGQFSLFQYETLLTDPYWIRTTLGSLGLAGGTATLSTTMGLILAIVVFKTRLALRRVIMTIAVLPMILPGFVTSLAYIFLFGRNGLITYQWLHISWDIYSWKSVLILQSLGFTTTAFFLIAAVVAELDPRVEDAARNLGAGEWHIFTSVTLPLMRPGIVAAALLSFLRSLADFGTPYIMGGRFNTLATASYSKLIGTYNTELAAALNAVLLCFCLAAFTLYTRFQQQKKRPQAVQTKEPAKPLRFHPLLNAFLLTVCLLFCITIVSLMLSVLLAAFTRHLGGDFAWTLEHFKIIPQRGWNSIRNTIIFASATSLIMTAMGIVLAYLVSRTRFWGRGLLDAFATIPFAIPGTFMGLAFALAFNQPPLLISGTWAIVIICTVVRELPLGLRAGVSVLVQQDADIEDAAANLGDSRLGRFLRVIVPLSRPALLVSAFYAFIATSKTLGAIIFIISPGNKVLSADVFEATVRGDVGDAAALSVIVMLIASGGVLAIFHLGREKRRLWTYSILEK